MRFKTAIYGGIAAVGLTFGPGIQQALATVSVVVQPPSQVAHRRQEEQYGDDVGNEAGNDEQDRRQHDHRTMRELAAWVASGIHFRPHPRHDAKTLVPEQQTADDTGKNDQPDRRQGADFAADDNEAGDLQKR